MAYPLTQSERADPLHLLVVDDHEFDRRMIAARLREVAPDNTVIVEAISGSEALHLVTTTARVFDCVLLDLNLPDINGVDITSIMMNIRPETTIIIITAETDADKALVCLKAGAEDFLIKGEYSNRGLYRAIRYAI